MSPVENWPHATIRIWCGTSCCNSPCNHTSRCDGRLISRELSTTRAKFSPSPVSMKDESRSLVLAEEASYAPSRAVRGIAWVGMAGFIRMGLFSSVAMEGTREVKGSSVREHTGREESDRPFDASLRDFFAALFPLVARCCVRFGTSFHYGRGLEISLPAIPVGTSVTTLDFEIKFMDSSKSQVTV